MPALGPQPGRRDLRVFRPEKRQEVWDYYTLELSSHVLKRMVDRGFSEVDLRSMISAAMILREDQEPGRWVVETWYDERRWEVIMEPDPTDQLLVVITAYPVESL